MLNVQHRYCPLQSIPAERPDQLEEDERCEWDAVHFATVGRGVQGRVVKKGIVVAGKYTPLENYLRNLPANQKEVSLSFEQIERRLNSKLPSSAYEDDRWWMREKEGNHVNARAWANAGWRVESVDFNRKQARLVRV